MNILFYRGAQYAPPSARFWPDWGNGALFGYAEEQNMESLGFCLSQHFCDILL